MCEAGQLIKVSKDKQGVITRDVLTKQWTDWVDYWAVDFNYESRKEIIKVPKGTGINDSPGTPSGPGAAQRELELARRPTSRNAGPAPTSSRTSGRVFGLDRSENLELTTAPHTYASARTLHDRRQGDRHLRQRHHDARADHRRLGEFAQWPDQPSRQILST